MSVGMRERIARALFEGAHQGFRLIAWSDETRDFYLRKADELIEATPDPTSEMLEVLRQARITAAKSGE